MYAFWAARGYMPDVVDEWPIEWASGWLLARALEAAPVEAWKNQPVGFGGDVPGEDPWWEEGAAEPPPPEFLARLPFHQGGE